MIRDNYVSGFGEGGGFFARADNANLTIVDSVISGNQTESNGGGGALRADQGVVFDIIRSTIEDNIANLSLAV